MVWKSEGKNQLDDLGADGRILLYWLLKNWDGSMDWVDLAQDKDNWRAFVHAAVNLQFPKNCEIS
jgi:hypothetical protein